MDEEGLLYFVGRKDEMIKCGGNRISPNEVEEVLLGMGEIAEAVAFGMPNDIYGQKVFAVVSLQNGGGIDRSSIMKYCIQNMPPYMVPAEIDVWKVLPRTANGKLNRSAIKHRVYKDHGLSSMGEGH